VAELEPLGVYQTGVFDEGAAEIVDHHPGTQRLFMINGFDQTIDVLDIADPTMPQLVDQIPVDAWGASPNSVTVHGDWVAVAVESEPKSDPGRVVMFDASTLDVLAAVEVGALPDMLTFTPDGTKLVVACEGEPLDDYLLDPAGSVAIIDVSGDLAQLGPDDVTLAGFDAYTLANLDPLVRVFGPGSSVAEDLEPEYVAVAADSTTAWVALQENAAMARVDLLSGSVTDVWGLGFVNHSLPGYGLDPSDQDDAVAIANWPVFGMVQPDALVSFEVEGQTYLIGANEGDAREWGDYDEADRVGNLDLDPDAFPNAAALQADEQLGRLNVTNELGDLDDDGDFDRLYSFGTRSIAVWNEQGTLVWDSGDLIEQQLALALPEHFNSNHTSNDSFDGRSDDKGPEPEGIAVAWLWGRPYAFVGLERISGVMVFDLSNPQAPSFVLFDTTRDFAGDPELGSAGDLGPEGLHTIAAADSPNGEPLLVVGYEVSGTVRLFQIVGA
jgi:hypothetical protein